MIIVDDRLSLDVLAGRRDRLGADRPDVVATTWGFHYRLLRALADDERVGQLSRAAPTALRAGASEPPESILLVLDPRTITARAAELAVRHHLNLLAAELVAAAVEHDARVALSANNVGRSWPAVLADEGVDLRVVG